MARPHLIGAYGMLWDRAAVKWHPGISPKKWQLLGYRGSYSPKLQGCDFRTARGFYVLFDEFRAVYAGLARGNGGIGARLKAHHTHRDDWTRFCWFAFDDVKPAYWSWTWSEVMPRKSPGQLSPETVVRESEALLINVLGLRDQNAMKFLSGQEWTQLTDADFVRGGLGRRLDVGGFTDPHYLGLASNGVDD